MEDFEWQEWNLEDFEWIDLEAIKKKTLGGQAALKIHRAFNLAIAAPSFLHTFYVFQCLGHLQTPINKGFSKLSGKYQAENDY